jgi:hypothetical protein
MLDKIFDWKNAEKEQSRRSKSLGRSRNEADDEMTQHAEDAKSRVGLAVYLAV